MSLPYFVTWQAQAGAAPTSITGGEGAYFDTPEGRVLDLGALVYQVNVGHGHPRVIEAVRAQASRLCVAPPNADFPEKRELAERLLAAAPPGFSKVLFTLGGSDANENALKIARMVTGRYKSIARYRSYHGATLGAVALGGDWRRAVVEPAIPGVVHVRDLDEGCEGTEIPRVLELEENVGAVFLESVVGANGVLIPPPGQLRAIREATRAHGALMVMDEVLVGFGRTGRFFGLERVAPELTNDPDLAPDVITCGKAITSGYAPLGAVLVHERVAEVFEDRILACGLTHHAHPLGIAAALETMKVMDDEDLVARAAALEGPLFESLRALCDRLACASGARGVGLLGAVDLELDEDALGRLRAALRAERIHVHIKGRRQLRRAHGGALVVSPPLCIDERTLTDGVRRVGDAIERVA